MEKKNPEPIMARIKKMRKRLGVTQPQMAKHLGINVITYCQMENGKTDPKLSHVQKCVELLKKESARAMEMSQQLLSMNVA